MIDLLYFTNRACAEAGRAAKRRGVSWVLGPVRHRINRVDHTVVLHTTSRTIILRLEKLIGP